MPDSTPTDHLAWAICAAVRPERDEDGERPCRVPCAVCRAGAAAVIRAAADQVDAVNVPDHIRGEGYWAYRNGRAAAKDYLIAKAAAPAAPPLPEPGEQPVSQPYKLPALPGEVGELVAWLRTLKSVQAQKAATLLEQFSAPAPAVVPVAVDLKEKDFDAEGRCWHFMPGLPGVAPEWRLIRPVKLGPFVSHRAPAHAIPLPQGGEGE